MKSLYLLLSIGILLISIFNYQTISLTKGGLKDPPKKSAGLDLSSLDIDKLSEKELDALLNDPKGALKINPRAELKKPASKKSKYSDSYKEHLESLNKEGLNVEDTFNFDTDSSEEIVGSETHSHGHSEGGIEII